MDPFAIRLDFLSLLRKLNASQGSIAKLLSFSTLHAAKARGDIWSCIVSECSKTNLNSRLNILFLIDAILSSSAVAASAAASMGAEALDVGGYQSLVARDLREVMSLIVPATWEGIRLNADSATKVLATWKAKRFFDPLLMQQIDEDIAAKQEELAKAPPEEARGADLTEADVLRRIEEDRERHKRLRERGWILPSKSFLDALPSGSSNGLRMGARSTPVSLKVSPASPRDAPPPRSAAGKRSAPTALPPPATKRLKTATTTATAAAANGVPERAPDAADIEFDMLWETTSDLHDDDLEAIREEDTRWWGGAKSIERRDEQMREQEEKRRKLAEEDAERARREAELEQRAREKEEEERQRARAADQAAKELEIQREQQHLEQQHQHQQYHHHQRHALPPPQPPPQQQQPSMWPTRHSPPIPFESSASAADIMPPHFHPLASPMTPHGFKYGNGPPPLDSPYEQHNSPASMPPRHEDDQREPPHQRGGRRSMPKGQGRSFGGGGGGGGAQQGFSSANSGGGVPTNGNRWGRKGRQN